MILGTVPVEPDGSASFKIPANTPVSFLPRDERGQVIQLMRSWATAMPGENLSCVGCHERAAEVATSYVGSAMTKTPAEITPWRGPTRGFSFQRDVFPALVKHCGACHGPDKKDKPNILDRNPITCATRIWAQ
jgi:hypothetical protein